MPPYAEFVMMGDATRGTKAGHITAQLIRVNGEAAFAKKPRNDLRTAFQTALHCAFHAASSAPLRHTRAVM
jgi:hypothetical protein